MNRIVINRLFESFTELERAVKSAKDALESKKNPPQEILGRITHYEQILDKQRSLASALCGYANLGDWGEVTRHVRLINGLSAMIRDDAREIVAGFKPTLSVQERELMLS